MNKTYIHSFLLFFLCSFILASGMFVVFVYFGLENWFWARHGSAKGMPVSWFPFVQARYQYHMEFWYLYIALVCCCYGALAAAFSRRIASSVGIKKWLLSAMVVFAAALLATPLAGMLFHCHDMLANFVPDGAYIIIMKLAKGFCDGAEIGWFVYLMSTPYTIYCAIIGIIGTIWLSRSLHPHHDK